VTGISFIVTPRWDFQLNPEWIFFGELGFLYNVVSGGVSSQAKGGGFQVAVGAGAMYNLAPDWAIRGDLSWQYLGIGLTHRF
jgi:hypothetical protein